MQCPNCKATLPDGAYFCNVCGVAAANAAVANAATTTTPAATAAGATTPAATSTGETDTDATSTEMSEQAATTAGRREPTVTVPAGRTWGQPSPRPRTPAWLWLIPSALLVAALVVAAVAFDWSGKLAERGRAAGASPKALWSQIQERQAAGAWEEVWVLLTQLRAADPAGTKGGARYKAADVSDLFATACTNLARQAEQAADVAAAGSRWACVLQERPADSEATAGKGRADLYLAGQVALDAGQYPEAIAAWEELQRTAPGYADVADRLYLARVAYGETLCAAGTPEEVQQGRAQLELANDLAPERPEAAERLAACLLPTPSPTPTATPPPLIVGVVKEDVTTLRVRSGPATGYFVVGKLTARDPVTITGRAADATWIRVEAASGCMGWVSSEHVQASYPIEDAPAVAVPPLPQRLLAAQASTDFSSQQGAGDWFYLISAAPGSLKFTRIPWDGDHWYRWCCDRNYNPEMRISSAGAYPSRDHDVARLWVNPYDGQLHIYGTARKEAGAGRGGNGVVVRIVQNAAVIWEQTLGGYDTTGTSYDLTVDAQSGDEFYFIVNARGNDLADNTVFDPSIELLHPEGIDMPPPVRCVETLSATATPTRTPTPVLCFEPRLRHYEEHKGCCAEVAGLVYDRQGKLFGPRDAAVHIRGPEAPQIYDRKFGVDASGGYSITALSVDKYTIWLEGPNIRSKKYAVEYPDWAKIRIIVDFYQVACW